MADGQVVFEITADGKSLGKALDKATHDIEKESAQWDKYTEKAASAMAQSFKSAIDGELLPALQKINGAIEHLADRTKESAASAAGEAKSSIAGSVDAIETAVSESADAANKAVKLASEDAAKAVKQDSKEIEDISASTSDTIGSRFSEMFKKITTAAVATKVAHELLEWGKAAVQAASDLEEVQNVVDTTFGDGAAQIQSWADNARKQFGLTEVQAKRFTSTLGAMMKSAGLAGPEIVEMSTDLAGLAADMASFYNLDFDTAFQKIRSGISGETEPLKQLGINMSVANLQAYALTQGITKAFDKMSQSEQTVLRYQYLMQATADAQGDFARTSDGYANSLRLLQTNLDSLKANVGQALIPVIGDVVGAINGMFEALNPDNHKTVLDDFASIDLGTDAKIAEINSTAEKARELIGVLESLGDPMGSFTSAANSITAGSVKNWEDLLTALNKTSSLGGLFGGTNAAEGTIRRFSDALGSVGPERARGWTELLSTLSEHAADLSALTGESVESTQAWLAGLAESANKLDPTKAEGWGQLFTALVEGLPGLGDTEEGKAFLESLAGLYSGLGGSADDAAGYLEALGVETGDIADKQRVWLAVCAELVKQIPGLSSIINTNTGEVEGGTDALIDYVDNWEKLQTKMALLENISSKEATLKTAFGDWQGLKNDMDIYYAVLQKRLKEFETAGGYDRMSVLLGASWSSEEEAEAIAAEYRALEEMAHGVTEMQRAYNSAAAAFKEVDDAVTEAAEALEEQKAAVEDLPGDVDALTESVSKLAVSEDEAANSLTAFGDALKSVNDYQQAMRDETARTVAQTVSGFSEIITPAQKARDQVKDLKKQVTEANSTELNLRIADIEGNLPSAQNMTRALDSQIEFMNTYLANLEQAKALGINEDLLASLSTGSAEDADYLAALAKASGSEVERLNAAYEEMQATREGFTDALTEEKLIADDAFQGLVDTLNSTLTELDMADGAHDAMHSTVEGIVSGIADALPDLTTQVDAVLAELARLDTFSGTRFSFRSGMLGLKLDGSNAAGLDYVPFNGYLSELHEGESILSAEEARIWREFKQGGAANRNSIDYGALSGAIWDNAPSRGGAPVYLNGQIVGRVLSDQQADSLRNLERSGWQA